jgi:site-specific DNA-methyltransferase (adenine-specific)
MFSFAGDTVVDPFCGTATTMIAALKYGRNSIGVELDAAYCKMAASRLMNENTSMFGNAKLQIEFKPQNAALVDDVMALNETSPECKFIGRKKTRRVGKLSMK